MSFFNNNKSVKFNLKLGFSCLCNIKKCGKYFALLLLQLNSYLLIYIIVVIIEMAVYLILCIIKWFIQKIVYCLYLLFRKCDEILMIMNKVLVFICKLISKRMFKAFNF